MSRFGLYVDTTGVPPPLPLTTPNPTSGLSSVEDFSFFRVLVVTDKKQNKKTRSLVRIFFVLAVFGEHGGLDNFNFLIFCFVSFSD